MLPNKKGDDENVLCDQGGSFQSRYLIRGDGSELACEYRLTPEEQEALRPKMDSYCMEQMGHSLEAAREQYLAEEQSPDGQEPPQQTAPTLQM